MKFDYTGKDLVDYIFLTGSILTYDVLTCKWFFSRTDSITNINEENGFYYLQQQAIRLIVCNILLYTDICILYIICTQYIKKGRLFLKITFALLLFTIILTT